MNLRAGAFFDVDGTLVSSNVVNYFVWIKTWRMNLLQKSLWIAAFVPRIPYYFLVDKISRKRFNSVFYRNYAALAPKDLEERTADHFRNFMEPRLYPGALARILEHRRNGDHVVLITGSLQPIIEPLAKRVGAAQLIAARLEQANGAFTGRLETGVIAGEVKGQIVRQVAMEQGLQLSHSYAYADSLDDVPMLEQVGHPTVINPRGRLKKLAIQRQWDILHWRN
ncbi:MAG: HAD family hydrolase [Acidobacteria bacterium]|nr:HAD family hydrolase [Acidobacteriota bacterium]